MDTNGQFHAADALPSDNDPRVPIGEEAELVPGLV